MDQFIVPALMRAGSYLVSLTMISLALFSVYSLSVIGERWWTFRQTRVASTGLLRRVLGQVEEGRLRPALAACEMGKGNHLGSVLASGLREFLPLESPNPGLHAGPELDRASLAAREAMQRATAAEIERLEQRLTSLATLGNISPFVGLFGTVIGIMRSFEAISRTGSGGLASVSAGIAEALVATAAGLFVAIPAVVAYNHFVSRVKTHATEMDGAASRRRAEEASVAMSLPSRSADRRMLSEINVTPLVDVMLVLLVIFMVTAPMLQRGTDVQLPQAEHSDVKEQDRLTLTLSRDGRIFLNNEAVPRAALRDRLVAAMRDRERTVQFRGDSQVSYGLVIEIMDTLKAAGIETVGMITERPSIPQR